MLLTAKALCNGVVVGGRGGLVKVMVKKYYIEINEEVCEFY